MPPLAILFVLSLVNAALLLLGGALYGSIALSAITTVFWSYALHQKEQRSDSPLAELSFISIVLSVFVSFAMAFGFAYIQVS